MSYEKILEELVKTDDRFLVMTAENRASIRNLTSKIEGKFFDVGISEMSLVGISAGLAIRGRIPIVHALAKFLTGRAYEFICTDVAYPKLPIKLIGSFAGLLSTANGPTHQAIDDIGLMTNLPNMNVFCPADIEDMLICLPQILKSDEPFYIRYNDQPSHIIHNRNYKIGESELISDGINITILVHGILLKQAIEVKNKLNESGLSVRIINLRTIKPLDEQFIHESANKTQITVTMEDHWTSSGLYSIISQLYNKFRINKTIIPIGFQSKWFKPAEKVEDIINYEGFNSHSIVNKILSTLKNENK
jgi:transketolase